MYVNPAKIGILSLSLFICGAPRAAGAEVELHGVMDLSMTVIGLSAQSSGVVLTDVGRPTSLSLRANRKYKPGFRRVYEIELGTGPDSDCDLMGAAVLEETDGEVNRPCFAGKPRFSRFIYGLHTPYGKFALGKDLAAITYVLADSDIFTGGYWGSKLSIGRQYFTSRAGGAVHYASPTLVSGYQLRGTLGFDRRGQTSRTIALIDTALTFKIGPAFWGMGIQRDYQRCNAGPGENSSNGRTIAVGTGYTIGVSEGSLKLRTGGAVTKCSASTRVHQWSGGLAYRIRGFLISYQLQHLINKSIRSSAIIHSAAVSFRFNRNASVYVSWARLNNNPNTRFALAAARIGILPARGSDVSVFAVGMQLSF